jgi:hypothetical protein
MFGHLEDEGDLLLHPRGGGLTGFIGGGNHRASRFQSMNEGKMKFVSILVAALVVAAPAVAVERGTASERAACTPDVFRLCLSEIPNVDGIVACLKREKSSLSAGCRRVIVAEEKTVATRSIKTDLDWCRFDREPVATDEVWRSWCKDRARVD